MCHKTAPYGGMLNGSHVEKEKTRESKAKDTMVETEDNKLVVVASSSSFKGYPLQVRHKQGSGRGFILLLPYIATLPKSDAGSDVIKPASSFVIQNRQTSCSMRCPMYRTRC